MTLPPELQALVDRAAIHDVLMRYFHAADSADKALVRTCFTDDVKARYHGRAPVEGADALIGQIALFDAFGSGACKIATHFVGNVQYKLIGTAHAETETNAFAFLVRPAQPSDQVAMRSLRYLDRWVRQAGLWKIAERIHTLDWHGEVPASAAATLAQRVNAFPAPPTLSI
ncbi:hypothetical protein GCM10023165_44150 [Variovorax defluvii]|uniref:SnoaL-like domain-containing protein n=1 Tax=Variovorax defluvii TaxID=913761 RepID=A0ABP8I9A1_9BURK